MQVAIINIGDELLSGRTQDLNAFWLGKFLFSKGIKLSCARTIPDDEATMIETFKELSQKYDVVITSGGVGPTLDDKTKSCLCKAFGKELILSHSTKEIVIKQYARLGKNWEEFSEKFQARSPEQHYEYIPQGFESLYNPIGLAPGFFYKQDKKLFFSCPGVPREFVAMVEQEIYPIMQKAFNLPQSNWDQFIVRTRDIPEENIFYKLDKELWSALEKFGKVASLPTRLGVDIIITANQGTLSQDDKQQLQEIFNSSPIKPHIWQFGNLELEQFIIQRALEKKLTFGFAESCTGGLLSHKITNISGSSAVFYGGIVSYDNSVKINSLHVPQEQINEFGAVSEQVAQSMATGALQVLGVDIAIATSGIAGPTGGSPQKPVGLVAIGQANSNNSKAQMFQYKGTREELKERFARKALYTLLDEINLH